MEDVERRIAAIGADREHGAAYLTREAVRTLGFAAAACRPGPGWSECLEDVAERLVAGKPTMASLANATRRLLGELLALGPRGAGARARELVERLVAELRASGEEAVGRAAALVPADATLLTCSYSSAVLRTVGLCRDAGRTPAVAVLETAPGQESAGRRLAGGLNDVGITVRVVGPDAFDDALSGATLALVGADAVTPELIVNGSPTLALAESAWGKVPLYTVCESIKLIADIGTEPGYDRIPFEMVTGVITEHGTLTQADVRRRVSEVS